MTREHKLSLILGFAVVLVVGVLLSDHLSGARKAQPDQLDPATNLALLDDSTRRVTEPPSLVLVDPRGRPVAIDPAPAANIETPVDAQIASADAVPEPFSDSTMFKPVSSAESDPGRLAQLQQELAGTFTDLANGRGPEAAAAIDSAPPTIKMTAKPEPKRQPVDNGAAPLRTYTIRANDTLWSIAQRTLGDGFRHKELAALNKDRIGPDGELRVGASLRLPADAQLADAAPVSTRERASTEKPAAKSNASKPTGSYTVKSGDTLGEISQKLLGSSRRFREILEANRDQLDDADSLRAGMVLKIPAR
jgi:nucleoid-associated protein YgaU